MIAPAAFVQALDALPDGGTTGHYAGRRYLATKTSFSGGRSVKLVARELGGTDRISLNLYRLASGPRLFPCEMSTGKVTAFVAEFAPERG